MKKFIVLLIFSIVSYNCKQDRQLSKNYESGLLKINKVSANVFVHVSYLQTDDFGKVACNGMVYFNQDEAIVFDTPVDNDASRELIQWIQEDQKKQVKSIVITHFHNDCLGGLKEFHKNGIDSYANYMTIKLARDNNVEVLPQYGFTDNIEFDVAGKAVFARFFGEGHTIDNIVGYIPDEKALFGGCLIKSLNAGKGYLGDANITAWPHTVKNLKSALPNLEIVIPGHGSNGDTELLDYTVELFDK